MRRKQMMWYENWTITSNVICWNLCPPFTPQKKSHIFPGDIAFHKEVQYISEATANSRCCWSLNMRYAEIFPMKYAEQIVTDVSQSVDCTRCHDTLQCTQRPYTLWSNYLQSVKLVHQAKEESDNDSGAYLLFICWPAANFSELGGIGGVRLMALCAWYSPSTPCPAEFTNSYIVGRCSGGLGSSTGNPEKCFTHDGRKAPRNGKSMQVMSMI